MRIATKPKINALQRAKTLTNRAAAKKPPAVARRRTGGTHMRFVCAVADALDIPIRELLNGGQASELVRARRVVILLMDSAGHPAAEIARSLGLHHSTILHHLDVLNTPGATKQRDLLLQELTYVRSTLQPEDQ